MPDPKAAKYALKIETQTSGAKGACRPPHREASANATAKGTACAKPIIERHLRAAEVREDALS